MNPLDYFEAYARRYQPYKGGAWCYEDGCLYRGLVLLNAATRDDRWAGHLLRLASAQVDAEGGLKGYDPADYNIDNILSGRVLFFLHERTGDPRYLKAADRLMAQLRTHPRTAAGNYWHKQRYPHQVWLDGLYMGLPFQIEYAMATGKPALIADALQQFATALALTDAGGGLFVHGYDESRQQAWADKTTGKSPAIWARAMGWLAMAIIDALELLPEDEANTSLRARTLALLAALARHQTENGLWLQVLDAPDLPGNYEESSASAMFAYALLKSSRLKCFQEKWEPVFRSETRENPGRFQEKWEPVSRPETRINPERESSLGSMKHVSPLGRGQIDGVGEKALQALLGQRLVEEEGQTRFSGIVQVAGLGGFDGRYRDGSPGYYLTEAVVSDDVKGVGPLMMAYAEKLLRQP
ncbi:glycoside hydrolase family 88/105 protein [Rhizobium paknamense]|uniref:Unsaturated rhamnogalacturonyl hydrolase n=1 Tax=Rhizobium paknamense TaxID=1206817 RepID=A0ABU0ICB5_9HYPH|nr:glycoside hydrolase family 88 protein [Rhizobium paknamense]MDQ0455880.1 unsaturated rhamnogalacturonyl hydrolase [Rhizobium paknamense]